MTRIIAHLDMDAFFANAELVRQPALKGMPVVVGGPKGLEPLAGQAFPLLKQYEGRGVLTTANYEARKLGLHSAMPMMKAAKLAPDVVLLPADFEWYKALSNRFKAAVRILAPHVEDRGIDEIYIDLTEQTQGSFEVAVALAKSLQAVVFEATGGMTCSIGLSANLLTSKICSDLKKPNGITVVQPHEFEQRIWPLPVGKINGVGPKSQAKLAEMGVLTVADLAAVPQWTLCKYFGENYGAWLHQSACGVDPRELTLVSEPKSISRETTFQSDMHVRRHREQLTVSLLGLAQRLQSDLERKQCVAQTIGVKVRFADFCSLTRDFTLTAPVWRAEDIVSAARRCLKKIPFDSSGARASIRLLGIRASNLKNPQLPNAQLQFDFEGEG